MHLSEQMPSIWYEVGLHCVPLGPKCPFNVVGFSFPGAPGVIVGHNDRIAWGFTNVDPSGNPVTVTNDYVNFGWEYVWHCHILGHEENDMMRLLVLEQYPKRLQIWL
jgi:hypothetical protein